MFPFTASGAGPEYVLLPSGGSASGAITYGAIASGTISTFHLASGPVTNPPPAVLSGAPYSSYYFTGPVSPYYSKCFMCGKLLQGETRVTVTGASGLGQTFCWDCAGYRYEPSRRFLTREDYIREDLPKWLEDFPNPVVADWLEEQQRYNDAKYMRNLPVSGMSEH